MPLCSSRSRVPRWGVVLAGSALLWSASHVAAVPGEHYPATRTRLFSRAEAGDMTDAQRRYAVNEMYARHGYLFGDMALRKQFLQFDWYHPVPGRTQSQAKTRFNSYERRNLERLSAARDVQSGFTVRTTGALQGEHYPQTRQRILTDSEIAAMSPAQLRYALNEIYARHGLPFSDSAIRKQFLRFTWYHPVRSRTQSEAKTRFNKFERANQEKIVGLRDTAG